MRSKEEIKAYLEQKLLDCHAFWSFYKDSCRDLSDRNLIKYVLIHLDLDDIQYLFQMYSKKEIKKVWLEELVPQGDYLNAMNLCFALIYFDIKHPRNYLKSMQTRHINKLIANG
ncbi:MAG: hypothetical protein LBT24_02065 [Tannerella sp.]|jgi:hypothetical protein|nr:hypothetical protein [Tannerella sp.]